MNPSPFEAATRLAEVASGRFALELTEDWYQGRGVYGGLVSALLAEALAPRFEERPLRTLHVCFLAPAVAGPAVVEAEVERDGRSVGTGLARLNASDQLVATALATFARPRKPRLRHRARPMPAIPRPEEVADGPEALYVPAFCQHFEFRQALGPPPFSGGEAPWVAGWCRPRIPTAPSAALVIALLDAWAPAALALSDGWRGAASVDLTVQLLGPIPDVAPDAFWAFEARASVVDEGYADETATLWAPDGTPVATARQLVALFG